MKYIFLLTSIILFALAYANRLKLLKLKDGGETIDIITAKTNTSLFFMLGLTSSLGYFILMTGLV